MAAYLPPAAYPHALYPPYYPYYEMAKEMFTTMTGETLRMPIITATAPTYTVPVREMREETYVDYDYGVNLYYDRRNIYDIITAQEDARIFKELDQQLMAQLGVNLADPAKACLCQHEWIEVATARGPLKTCRLCDQELK
jgi:hypothetical protein